MKYTALILGFLLFSASSAQAVCSGGFDGKDATVSGCSELGELGDLVYERNDSGMVLHKRSNEEIKQYLISTVEERLKNRGVTMIGKKGHSIIINETTVVFDLFNQNGDKVYTYTIDLDKGIPLNEKDIIDSRKKYDEQKMRRKTTRLTRIQQLQAMGDKIKAEEIDKKAAAKK